jgi:hypothetical protein
MYTLQSYKEQRTELLHLDLNCQQPDMEESYAGYRNLNNSQDRSQNQFKGGMSTPLIPEKFMSNTARLLHLQFYKSSEYCLDN